MLPPLPNRCMIRRSGPPRPYRQSRPLAFSGTRALRAVIVADRVCVRNDLTIFETVGLPGISDAYNGKVARLKCDQ